MREMREIKVYKQKKDHGPSPPHHSYKKHIPPRHQPQPSTSPKFSQRNTSHLGIIFILLPHHHHYKKEVYFGMSLSLPPFSPSSLSKQRLNFLPYHFYLHKEEFFILISFLFEQRLKLFTLLPSLSIVIKPSTSPSLFTKTKVHFGI